MRRIGAARLRLQCDSLVLRTRSLRLPLGGGRGVDREGRRWLAPFPTLPHQPVGRLETAAIGIRIEQRAGQAVAGERAAEARELPWYGRELEGSRLVLAQAARHEFREPHGAEETPCDARRETLAAAGEHGKAGPERIARGRV